MIANETDLEELLSRPTDRDIVAMSQLRGPLLILGAGGKMGPTLAMRARRAGAEHVIAVARFSSTDACKRLDESGIETISADLLDEKALQRLPDAPHVIFMAAMKFGTSGAEHLTWALNTYLPGRIAERYRSSAIVAFSTGNVYPLSAIAEGGSTEESQTNPVGEYAQSALGRERMFQYGSKQFGTRCVLLRLNYAVELRYGVLLDIGLKVFNRSPVDVSMGMVNVIWQGDANSACLQSFRHCQAPPLVLNLTGPETLSVRWIAQEFGNQFEIEPKFEGSEQDTALLSNSTRAMHLFGYPTVTPLQAIEWTAG
ncbi:MAG TPA: NAD-dependent epimerase/dehydratase family protein, partial [Bryobacteraceae bacterium]|nr:NAD-dependent epimerase/dehydratase family protein [Bryobacteraceae bacterium]